MAKDSQPSKAVVTAFFGAYERLRPWSKPRMEAYAARIGAEVVELTERRWPLQHPSWEKFQLYRLCKDFDRAIWMDADLKIEDGCPDLFEVVPRAAVGMFDESLFGIAYRVQAVARYSRKIGVGPVFVPPYFNAGLMVLSREHWELFRDPQFVVCPMIDQTLINIRVRAFATFALPESFNRMRDHDTPAHIQHFATMTIPDRIAAFSRPSPLTPRPSSLPVR